MQNVSIDVQQPQNNFRLKACVVDQQLLVIRNNYKSKDSEDTRILVGIEGKKCMLTSANLQQEVNCKKAVNSTVKEFDC